MEVKSFKADLTYCCKKFIKEGKKISSFGDNLSIVDGQFVAEGNHLDPLETFVLVKGYTPSLRMITDRYYTTFNLSMVEVISEQAPISKDDLYQFLDGFDNVWSETKNKFYAVGVYIREKFTPEGVRSEPLRL